MDKTAKRKGETEMTETDDIITLSLSPKNYVDLGCVSAIAGLGAAGTVSSLVGAGTIMQEVARQQIEQIYQVQQKEISERALISVQSSVMQVIAQQQNEVVMRSAQAYMTNPSIYPYSEHTPALDYQIKVDEEITIKKSEWNNLLEKVDNLEEEIKTLKISKMEQVTKIKSLQTQLYEAKNSLEEFIILQDFLGLFKKKLEEKGYDFYE